MQLLIQEDIESLLCLVNDLIEFVLKLLDSGLVLLDLVVLSLLNVDLHTLHLLL